MPVDRDLGLVDDEDVCLVGPFVDGIVQPVEVRPPERLVLAAVIAACGRHQRNRRLLGSAVRARRDAGELLQLHRERIRLLDGAAIGNRLGANRCDAAFEGPHQQPIAQFAGGPAVVLVVVLDLLEHGRRLVELAVAAQFAVARVLGDRVGGRGDVAGSQLRTHVQRLQRLQAERLATGPNALAHNRIQVDQRPAAQQVVDLVFADAVAAGQPQQRRLLVCGVVVDVHVGKPLAPLGHQREEVDQRFPLVGAVMRPQRMEGARFAAFENTEQIFQAPVDAVGRPQRVALEVEEQVALVGLGQQGQRLRVGHLELRCAGVAFANLQCGLRDQGVQRAGGHVGDRAGVLGQLGHRGDARVDQLGALGDPHARDEQQVVGRTHLLLADRAAEAGPHAVVFPAHRATAGVVIVEQALQSRALLAVHRDQLVDLVVDRGAVAENQFGFRVHRNAGVAQRVGVGGDLKQRGDFRRAGQLGVGNLVLSRRGGPGSRRTRRSGRRTSRPGRSPARRGRWHAGSAPRPR